jgi:hypothetical protein
VIVLIRMLFMLLVLLPSAARAQNQLDPFGFPLPSLTGNEIVDCQLFTSPYITTCTTQQIANLASCVTATTSIIGCVKPDGTTIVISGGTIAAAIPPPDVNVTDYGAVAGTCGNSAAISANNTAIQLAFNSGRNVNFPTGNYPHTTKGFNIQTASQVVHGPACTGAGTAAPFCPASIQDCTMQSSVSCAGTPADPCGYLSVFATGVEIHDLWINGNNPLGSGVNSVSRKGVFARGNPIDNLYVHDMYVTNTNAESIYQDSTGTGTKFLRNTVAHGQYAGFNFNGAGLTNGLIADNIIIDQGICILVLANDAYVLRNVCQGGPHNGGGVGIHIVAPALFVAAYNTVKDWNASGSAVGAMQIGFSPLGNDTGPGVVAFNTIINNMNTTAPGLGAGLVFDNVTGPVVATYNSIINSGDPGFSPPAVLFNGSRTDAILFSNNVLNGSVSVSPIGIEIYSDVPGGNRIQIDSTNTFGGIPTQTSYMVAPGGASGSVFTPTVTAALPYLPALLSEGINANPVLFTSNFLASSGTRPIGTTGSCNTSVTVVGGTLGALNGTWTSTAICGAAGTIILSGLPAAPAGWTCPIVDQTTSTARIRQTGSSTTSVTYTVDVATVANDILRFGPCAGY